MPRKLPDGTIFFSIQYSESNRSNELGWVTARLTTSSETSEVYWTVKPRSALHLSASSLNWLTPVPAIRSVTGSAAWTNGNWVSAPAPSANPAVEAVCFRNLRRDITTLCRITFLPDLRSAHDMRIGVVPIDSHDVPLGERRCVEGLVRAPPRQALAPIRFEAQLDLGTLVFDCGDSRLQRLAREH